jgi:hypothetical protein
MSLLVALAPGPAHAAEDYGAAFTRAAELERSGDPAGAATAMEALLPEYAEDYSVQLRLGWLYFEAEQYPQAERAYAAAAEISDGAADAKLGLAWTHYRLGRLDEAASGFEAVLDEMPDNESARQGLAFARPEAPDGVTAAAWLSGQTYQGHPVKKLAAGVSASLSFRAARRLVGGGTYRYTAFKARKGPTGQGVSDFDQHEGYVSIGPAWRDYGAAVQYAYVSDSGGNAGAGHVLGGTLRWSPFGDIWLSGSWSMYDDEDVLGLEPSWLVSVGGGLWMRLAAGLQSADSGTFASAHGRLAWVGEIFSAWVGGKVGEEMRPVYWDVPLVLNLDETVVYGASAGVGVALGGGWGLSAAYSVQRFSHEVPVGELESNGHVLSVGLSKAWVSGGGR